MTCPTCKSDQGKWSFRSKTATDCDPCHEVKRQATLTALDRAFDPVR
jgi:hypothetical protein